MMNAHFKKSKKKKKFEKKFGQNEKKLNEENSKKK